MDGTYAPTRLNWDRGLQSLMRLHKMNDYIVIPSEQTREELDCRQQVLGHGNKEATRKLLTRTPLSRPIPYRAGPEKQKSLQMTLDKNIRMPGCGNEWVRNHFCHICGV